MAFSFSGNKEQKVKKLTPTDALVKIRHYCAYQERAHKEVKQKLFEYGLCSDDVDEILSRLITDGFLNEERFAKAFAGGKFRVRKWGRVKIQNELEMLGLTPRCIQRGLSEIDDQDYQKTLSLLIGKKLSETEEENIFRKKDKVARYLIGKGYEPELVWRSIKEISKS
jgi:regulatory protein